MAYKSGKERRAEIMRTRSVRLARKAQEITNVMDEKLKDLARGKLEKSNILTYFIFITIC